MLFEIDIDETIASGAKVWANYYLAQLGLESDAQTLQTITSYQDVMRLPVLVQYCRASPANMAHFEAIQKQARHCPEVFRQFEAFPGALEGTSYLAELGMLRYNTVRPPELEEVTRQWLAANGFVNADQIIFSRSSKHKLVQISEYAGASILIDDRYMQVLTAFEQIVSGDPFVADLLQHRLTLVAFGTNEEIPAQHTANLQRVVALPSWQHLKERINPCLQSLGPSAPIPPTHK